MIASVRGLIVLLAMAVALAVVVVAAAPEPPATVDRSLVASTFAPQKIEIDRKGQPPIVLTRGERGAWTHGDGALVYPPAIDALLSALSGARWHRRGAIDPSWPIGEQMRADGETFRRGPALAGAEQSWIVHRERALLVDSWVARALFPEALALRARRPLADAAAASSIIGPNVRFDERHQRQPIDRWITAQAHAQLTDALAAVELVSLDGIQPGPAGAGIELGALAVESFASVREAGTCAGGRIYLTSRYGGGCADAAAWKAALAAFEPFMKDDPSLVDTRVVPFTPATVTYPGDVVIDLVRQSDEVDPDRIAMMLTALRTPGEIVARPKGAPRTTLVVARDASAVTLELHDGVIVRKGETFALRVPPEIHAFLLKPPTALRNTTLWREDATTLSTFKLDGVTYARGQVIGEWARTPVGKVDTALVDAVAESLASVRGVEANPPTAVAHRISVTFTPPVGGPKMHSLELGAGCEARVDGKGVRLDLPLCMAVAALAGSR